MLQFVRLYDGNYLVHHGIKGQKWGVRRFQNEDGSLTEAGKKRYNNYTAKEKALLDKYTLNKYVQRSALSKMDGSPYQGIKDMSSQEYLKELEDIQKAKVQKHKESLGEDTYNRVTSTMSKVVSDIYKSKFSDYNGKGSEDIKRLEKERQDLYDEIAKKAFEIEKQAELDYYNRSNSEKIYGVFQKMWNGKDIKSDYIKKRGIRLEDNWLESDEGKKWKKNIDSVNAKYETAKTIASNEWKSKTIEDVINSVPKDKRAEVYDLLRFDWYGHI